VMFHGDTVEYEIETASGSIIASVSDPSVGEILEPMAVVRVDLATDRGWVLPASDRD